MTDTAPPRHDPMVRPPTEAAGDEGVGDTIMVSVIMAAYNAGPYLKPSIDSLVNQTIDASQMEIIIVDDGSTDGTGEELDRRAAEHPHLIRVTHQANSGGPATPRNAALDMARGRYIFFLDADDYLGTESLARLVACAEENGSDVVLGRMKGINGRGVPVSMYKKNDPDADLFESRVYWTLNAGKLYRRELVERLGMRFMPDMPNGSDQPFTARAYLNARRISVLADYDFYHAVLRGDGHHVTLSGGAESRVLLLERTMGIVEAHVDPGPKRDALMLRHFRVDMTHLLNHLAREQSTTLQAELFERIKALVDAHYTDRINQALDPLRRLRYHLVKRGLLRELVEVYRFWSAKVPYRILVENGRGLAALPYFRDPSVDLPDHIFDITEWVHFRHWLGSVALGSDGVLRVTGHAFLERIDHQDAQFELILRRRSSDEEYRLPAERTATPDVTITHGEKAYDYDQVGFDARIDLHRMADEMPLPIGTWDAHVAVSVDGLTRIGRLGSRRSADLATRARMHILPLDVDGPPIIATTYFTQTYENLSLEVGDAKHTLPGRLRVKRIGWKKPGTLTLRGSLEIDDLPATALKIGLVEVSGARYKIPLAHREGAFTVQVPVRRLPWGDWRLHIEVDAHGGHWSIPVPLSVPLPRVRWYRLGLPGRARSIGTGRAWTLRIARVSIIGAVRRRIRRLGA